MKKNFVVGSLTVVLITGVEIERASRSSGERGVRGGGCPSVVAAEF